MPMQRQQAQDLFSDYVAGELDRALTVSLENHLATCAESREEVASLREVWGVLDGMPEIEPPRYFHENIMGRLAIEAEKEEEAAARKRSVWDWRSLFRSRSRTIAYGAAVLVLLLTSVEAVRTYRSEIGPFSWVLSALRPTTRPTVALQKPHVVWQPDAQGGGTLFVQLQAATAANGSANSLAYRLSLPGYKGVEPVGVITSTETRTLRIPLDYKPEASSFRLTVTLNPLNDTTQQQQETLAISPTSESLNGDGSSPAPPAP